MSSKKAFPTLTIVFLVLAGYCCPLVRNLVGIDMSYATNTLHLYYWIASFLYLVLAILVYPKLAGPFKSMLQYVLLVVLCLVLTEAACAIAYRWQSGFWSHEDNVNLNRHMFEKHPYMVGKTKKNAHIKRDSLLYFHNSLGYRGDEFEPNKEVGTIRIVTIGGSTTYGVGVNNEDTWPFQLEQELGEPFEVINLGIPGHSSAENLIQTALLLSDLQPDLAIYHIGLNDIRNTNIHNLKSDYSNYHAATLYNSLGLCNEQTAPMLATVRMMITLFQKTGVLESCPGQQVTVQIKPHKGVDDRAISLYVRNLKSIVALCHTQEIIPLFAPQILLEEVLKTGDYSWWVPYIPTDEIDDVLNAYNQAMKTVADSSQAFYSDSFDKHHWEAEDFVDLSHFNAEANQKMANLLAKDVRAIFNSDTLSIYSIAD